MNNNLRLTIKLILANHLLYFAVVSIPIFILIPERFILNIKVYFIVVVVVVYC